MEIVSISSQETAAAHHLTDRVIISFETSFRGNSSELAREPQGVDLFQREPIIEPANRLATLLSGGSPPIAPRNGFDLLQQSGFRVNVDCTSAKAPRSYGSDATIGPGVEHTDLPFMHEVWRSTNSKRCVLMCARMTLSGLITAHASE